VLHLLGLAIYVVLTVFFNWSKTSEAMKQLEFRPRSHFSGIIILLLFMVLPITLHLVGIFVHTMIGLSAFVVWTFLFHQTWAPAPPATKNDTAGEPAPAHEDTGDRTRAGR
jgi:uncharacterized membrane protein